MKFCLPRPPWDKTKDPLVCLEPPFEGPFGEQFGPRGEPGTTEMRKDSLAALEYLADQERQAISNYQRKGEHAKALGDDQTARLCFHIKAEEEHHLAQLQDRIGQLGSV